MTQRIPVALTIAGSDSSGGAGIQADLKTFSAFGVYGASATDRADRAEHARACTACMPCRRHSSIAQIDAVLADLVSRRDQDRHAGECRDRHRGCRAAWLRATGIPLVVDPVMVATSGDNLLDADAIDAVRHRLLPRATLVTPNMPEAARLLGERPRPRTKPSGEASPSHPGVRRASRAAEGRARRRRHRHRPAGRPPIA